jgi:hypothetical protein
MTLIWIEAIIALKCYVNKLKLHFCALFWILKTQLSRMSSKVSDSGQTSLITMTSNLFYGFAFQIITLNFIITMSGLL